MNTISSAMPTYSKSAVDTFVLFIPLVTAVLTAATTLLTMFIKEKLYQNSKDKNDFIGQRLQNCYTPLHLKFQTRKNYKVGFLKEEINDIIVKYGYLLEMSLLQEYIALYDKERMLFDMLEFHEEIKNMIADIQKKLDDLDENSPKRDKYYTSYMEKLDECIELLNKNNGDYGKKVDEFFEGIRSFRKNLETSYTELVKEYFIYFKTGIGVENSEGE